MWEPGFIPKTLQTLFETCSTVASSGIFFGHFRRPTKNVKKVSDVPIAYENTVAMKRSRRYLPRYSSESEWQQRSDNFGLSQLKGKKKYHGSDHTDMIRLQVL